MQIVVVSDTHERHEELGTLRGDVLIHCGDGLNGFARRRGSLAELDAWFGQQQFDRILCIGGNHDFELQERAAESAPPLRNAEYLEDRAFEYGGFRFFGSPWTPELNGWAYYQSDPDLALRWAAIPEDVDVLVTHTPPFGVLDRNSSGKPCGCPLLRERIEQVRPVLHCFGHVHASGGVTLEDGITFANACMVNSRYQIARDPLVFELAPRPDRDVGTSESPARPRIVRR